MTLPDISELFSLALHPKACWLLTMSLLHSLWQGAILGAIGMLLVRNKSALDVHTRFVTMFSILLLIAVSPVANFLWLSQAGKTPNSVEFATKRYVTESGFSLRPLSLMAMDGLSNDPQNNHSILNVSPTSPTAADSHTAKISSPFVAKATPERAYDWLVLGTIAVSIGYFCGVGWMLLRLGWGLKSNWSLMSFSKRVEFGASVPDSINAAVEKASQTFSRSVRPAVALFEGRGVAFVIGCFRPVILVNAALTTGLTPAQTEQIIAHELAHLLRFDPLTQVTQRLIESMLFFHPAVWYVSRQVSELREICCDDLVAKRYGRIQYANTLLACVEFRKEASQRNSAPVQPRPWLSLSVAGAGRSQLATRIEALLVDRSMRWSPIQAEQRILIPLLLVALMVAVGALISSQSIPVGGDSNVLQIAKQKAVVVVPSWKWQSVEPEEIDSTAFLFGGRKLKLSNSTPDDITVHAMVPEENRRFAQWHFGDSNSTRVSILIEVSDDEVQRLFVDSNRDRVVSDEEQVTTITNDGKTWLTDLAVEVVENEERIYSSRQIGITPRSGNDFVRITTLGYSQGNIDLAGTKTTVRRVDLDGNGLPTGSRDQIWFDFNRDGIFDLIDERKNLSNFLDLAGQRYAVRSDRLGQSLKLTASNDQGSVRFLFELDDKSATLLTLEGSLRDDSGMLIAIRPQTEPVSIPTGRYCVETLVAKARDSAGHNWQMTLTRRNNDHWFEVKTGEQFDLKLLDSIKFHVTPVHKDDGWSEFKTQLKPEIYTANGLKMTDFICDAKKETWHPSDQSVTAHFASREHGTAQPEQQKPCSSGFS